MRDLPSPSITRPGAGKSQPAFMLVDAMVMEGFPYLMSRAVPAACERMVMYWVSDEQSDPSWLMLAAHFSCFMCLLKSLTSLKLLITGHLL